MRRFCAVLNLAIGIAGAFGGFIITAMSIAFTGDAAQLSGAMIFQIMCVASLMLAGVLYACSGILLWKSDPVRLRKALRLQAIAIVLALVFCIFTFLGIKDQFNAKDEEVQIFFFVPVVGLFLASLEWVILKQTLEDKSKVS